MRESIRKKCKKLRYGIGVGNERKVKRKRYGAERKRSSVYRRRATKSY